MPARRSSRALCRGSGARDVDEPFARTSDSRAVIDGSEQLCAGEGGVCVHVCDPGVLSSLSSVTAGCPNPGGDTSLEVAGGTLHRSTGKRGMDVKSRPGGRTASLLSYKG